MIRHDVSQKIEPEKRHLRQHAAFVRNACGQDVIERRDAVGGDDQQAGGGFGSFRVLGRPSWPCAGFIDVANLAAGKKMVLRKLSIEENVR